MTMLKKTLKVLEVSVRERYWLSVGSLLGLACGPSISSVNMPSWLASQEAYRAITPAEQDL